MSGYLLWLADELRRAGVTVVEYDGWQTRARSSGGFAPGRPYGVWWHHTASRTTPANDADYMCHGSDNRPIANLLVARDGAVWVLAAGATNTNGKGEAVHLSRATVPADQANTHVVGMELANAGTGESYPAAQIDAAFAASNAINLAAGNAPSDVCTHQQYAPDRKIDPATAGAVTGPWRPGSATSSGTWNLDDLRAECVLRADATWTPEPEPQPPPLEDDEMALYLVLHPDQSWYVTDMATFRTYVNDPTVGGEGCALFGWRGADGGMPIMLGAGWAPFLDQLPITTRDG